MITCALSVLELLHEFNVMEGKDMLETVKANWERVCEQLNGISGSSSYIDEKNVLAKIVRNVYHKKPVSAVVIEEVCT